MARTVCFRPVNDGAQGSSLPVAASNAAKLWRATGRWPGAAPGGRTESKVPPT